VEQHRSRVPDSALKLLFRLGGGIGRRSIDPLTYTMYVYVIEFKINKRWHIYHTFILMRSVGRLVCDYTAGDIGVNGLVTWEFKSPADPSWCEPLTRRQGRQREVGSGRSLKQSPGLANRNRT
jgi:hypothetical protein